MKHDQDVEIDETDAEDQLLDWSPTPEMLARPRPEPKGGTGRLMLAAALATGVALVAVLYFLRPGPAAAHAETPMQNVTTEPAPRDGKVVLFELPPWDEAAYQRDFGGK